MARAFVLPDLGEGLTEAEIVKVLVQEGDLVQEDAPLLEVETDKATVEIPSPVTGRVTQIHVQPGQTVKVGAVLVTFDEEGGRSRLPAPAAASVAQPLAPGGVRPPALPKFERWGPVERQPLSHLRRTIAERMTLSATLVPHVTHFDRADITELDAIIRRNVEPARQR